MNADAHTSIVTRLYPGATLLRATRLAGGVSADVSRLDVQLPDGSTTRIVLRAHGASHGGHDADLEYRLLGALHRSGLPVPEPLLVDTSGTILADPYLVIEFVDGSSALPAGEEDRHLEAMADLLARIHAFPLEGLPPLPARTDPMPEVFDYLPEGDEWRPLATLLHALTDSTYREQPVLLHGDFWPQNLLWRSGTIAAVLDWEDAAIGDPLSDVAGSGLELRYLYGAAGMTRFTDACARHRAVDPRRLALWQVYVAAAAQHFMGRWGLDAAREAHMRSQALATLREASAVLMASTAMDG